MKKFFQIFIVIAALVALGAASTIRISDVVGLYTELANRPKISDGVNPWNYVYSKKQVQELQWQPSFLEVLKRMGCPVKALPPSATASTMVSSTSALTDGATYYTYFDLTDTIVSSGVGWVQRTAGVYTGDNYSGFSVWSVSTLGVLTKITQTVDDPSLFKIVDYTLGGKTWPTQVTLLPGKYAIALIWNCSGTATTVPVLYCHGAVSPNLTLFTPNSIKLSGTVTSQTAFPATTINMSAMTVNSVVFGVWFQ